MRKIGLVFVLCLIHMTSGYAAQKTMTCKMADSKEGISFVIPKVVGDLPNIDFPYPVTSSIFSMRDGNLLLVAMDEEDKSRVRILISAQAKKNSSEYHGQYMTDLGGNQIQIDNGPVTCKLK